MRGDVSLRVLESLAEVPQAMGDILTAFSLPYGSSVSQMERAARERRKARAKSLDDADDRRRFYQCVYHLKKDGLIAHKGRGADATASITAEGKRFLKKLRVRKAQSVPARRYAAEKDDTLKLVIFDIPEGERRKRDWLRGTIERLGFTMLQKSVWAGKVKVPQEFLEDLQRMRLLNFVEILAITKQGTLRDIQQRAPRR